MRVRRWIARWLIGLGCLWPSSALAQPSSPELGIPIAIDEGALSTEAVLAATGPLQFRVAARVRAANSAQLNALSASTVPLWLLVDMPSSVDAVEMWRQSLLTVLSRFADRVATVELEIGAEPAALASYAVRLVSTEARALIPGARIALGGTRMETPNSRDDVYTAELSPYIDLLVVGESAATDAAPWLERIDRTARLVVRIAEPGVGDTLARRLLSSVLRYSGGTVETLVLPAAAGADAALQVLAKTPTLLSPRVSAMDDAGSALTIAGTGVERTITIAHRLLLDDRTFATYLALPDGSGPGLEVSLRLTADPAPALYDFTTGQRRDTDAVSWDPSTRIARLRVPPSSSPLLVDFSRDATEVFGDRSEVVGQRGLSIDEIIARHQAVQRRQDLRVQTYMATVETAQHFRPSVADAGYDIVTDNRYFVAGNDIEWEELSFSVNGAKWGADRPPVPLLQPEKVLSLPLQLRFGSGYRYRLDGEATVHGYDCYVVRFEPTRSDVALYRGTVWIDRRSFARIRVQAVQSGLPAPVVSNEEIQDYAPPMMVGSQPVFLLQSLTARQIVLIAGRNVLVEKQVRFSGFRVNDPQFEAERGAARRSEHIMYRETDAGLRYYLNERGARVVSDRPTNGVRALAMGVYTDPSYAFPLPIFGINYLNFALAGSDSQLAILFGGVLAAGNIQRSKLGGTPLDGSVDFFGIAVPSSDRIFGVTGERSDERVLTWPMSTGLNLGWQYTPFQKLMGQYQVRFDAYVRDRTTSDRFTLPASTVTNGVGLSWEYRRGGFVLVATDTEYRRARWTPWGLDVDPTTGRGDNRTYAKHQVTLSRDWYPDAFQKVHLNLAYFGGRGLDRFSKYQFGMFDDTRLHGVPASGVRYAQLGMLRGSYSLNIFDVYRVDVFAEHAWARERPNPWERLTGLGAAVNFRAPKSTILRADFGKSFPPDRFRSAGSYTLQVLILKPMR